MKKRILSMLLAIVMVMALLPTAVFAAEVTENIHWAVVQNGSDVILYLGNAAHVMQADETLYADGAQGTHHMVPPMLYDRPYNNYASSITKVVIESPITPESCRIWFSGFTKCTSIEGLDNLDTSKAESMSSMFNYCNNLTSLDLSNFDTSSVTSMGEMFNECNSLTSLNLSNFNTSSVTNMSYMFNWSNNLTGITFGDDFDTTKVADMSNMFSYCKGLTSLDVSNFDTSNVELMSSMFSGCSGLTSLDLSSFNTSKVTNMSNMFNNCGKLTSLDLSGFNTSKVTNMNNMFNNCGKLTSLDLTGFDTSKVTETSKKFSLSGCSGLNTIKTPATNALEIDLPSSNYAIDGQTYDSKPAESKLPTTTGESKTLRRVYDISYTMNDGTNNSANPTYFLYSDDSQTITLTPPTKENNTFTGWSASNGVTVNGNSITIPAKQASNVTLTANFTPNTYTVTVTVTANPTEGGTVTGLAAGGSYNHGATVTLTATANEGYSFINWTKDGEVVSTSAAYTFTATETANYVANFEAITYDLWVGGVQVTSANKDEITTAIGNAASGTATYNPDTNTLTLDNFSYTGEGYKYDSHSSAAIYAQNDFIVNLVGSNTLNCTDVGIRTAGLTIQGNDKDTDTLTVTSKSNNIFAGDITISNATITAQDMTATGNLSITGSIVNSGDNESDGSIYARENLNISSSTINLNGDYSVVGAEEKLTITESTITTAEGKCSAIGASGAMEIVDSEVTVAEEGIAANDSLTIRNSTVTATGTNFGIAAMGGDMSVSGSSTVTATGTNFGIAAMGGMSVSGSSTVTATGANFGIVVIGGDMSVSGSSTVTATGGELALCTADDEGNSVPLRPNFTGDFDVYAGESAPGELVTSPTTSTYNSKYVKMLPHEHNYTYSAAGAVITESCTCGHSKTATLSFSEGDGSYTYTGSAITPVKVTCEAGWAGSQPTTITYDNNTDSGNANASLTIGNATATLSFTITKADVTFSKHPHAKEVAYNGEAQTLVYNGSVTGGTIMFSLDKSTWSKDRPTATDIGNYTVYYYVAGDSNHKDTNVFKVDASILKGVINPGVSIEGWIYGYGANAPTVTGNIGNGDVTYTYSAKGENNFTSTIPTEAGEYTIRATVDETANYNGGEATADFVIARRTVTLTSATVSKFYDGSALTNSTVTVSRDGFATNEGATYNVTGSQTEVGSSKNSFTYTLNDGTNASNYTITKTEGTLTVSQSGATMMVTANKNEYTYGETITITVSGIAPIGVAATNVFSLTLPTTDQVAIWNGDTQLTEPQNVTGNELTFTLPALDVGTYTLTAKFTGNANMAATSAVVSITVNKANQDSFTITNKPGGSIAYGNTFTLGAEGGTGTGAVTWSATGMASVDASTGEVTITGVGAFSVTATKAGGNNYTDATDTYSGTSVKATPNIGDVTYNGGALYDSTNISTVELTRSNTTIPGTLELTDSKLTAGTKAYNWKFTPEDSTNYNTIIGTVTLNVTADVLENIAARGTLTKTAYVYGDTFSIDGLTVTATYTSSATKNVTADVTFGALTVGQESIVLNYQGKTCTVSGITVSKKQLDVSGMSWNIPTGNDAVYSGSSKTAVLNGNLPTGVNVTKTGDTGTNVGSYTASAEFSLAEGYSADNYVIVGANLLTAEWAITALNVAEENIGISGVQANYTYTGNAIEPQVTVTVGSKILVKDTDYTVSYGTNTNVSTGGSVTVTLKGNYSGSRTVNFTILAKEQVDFSISGATTAVYGNNPITLTAAGGSGTGAITWIITSGTEFAEISSNGTTATLTIKGVGAVTVKATKATDGNYKEKVDTHEITISKATVDAGDFSYSAPADLVYSKTEKEATVTGNNAYGAISIKYYSDSNLTTVVSPINVGTYYVGITTTGGDNYEAVTTAIGVGSFEITARTVTVTAAAKTMKYGDDVPELTYTHDLLADDSFTGALATTATKDSNVGEYDIKQGTLSAGDNYTISFTGAKLTITQADGPAAHTVTGSYVNNGMTYTYTVNAINGAEYSMDSTTWQDSNVFENLAAGQKYTFYARVKETTNVKAGLVGQSAEVDLSKLLGKGTVTIADWTYGEAAKVPVTNSTTGNTVESYLYVSTDGKGYSSANAPTDAGEYKLTVIFAATTTHNGTTAYDTFTIAKATPAVTAPSGLTATYGDTLASVQLPAGWAWKDAATTEVGNVGDNNFDVIYTHPDDTANDTENYNQVEGSVTIKVSPKVVNATVTVVGENFVFNGSEQKPGVTVEDGETNITIHESEYTVSYTNNTNAGTATVTVTDKDGGNYTVTGETTFAIAKKASSALSGVEREFMRTIATTGNEIDVEAMLPDDHGTVTYTITSNGYTVLENVAVDANGKLVFDTKTSAAAASDTITIKVEMQNYTDVTLTVSVILNDKTPQEITGVSASTGLIYNGEAQKGYTGTPTSEDYTDAYEITYTGRSNTYNSSVAPTNAGDYTVTFKIPDSDLYYSGNISINFTIGKAQATVTADDKEAYIGSRMPELTYKVSGLIGNDTISVELSCDANMYRAGETPIVVTATDPNGNYEITTVNGTLTVEYFPYIPPIITPTYPPVVDSGDNGDVDVSPKNPEKGDTVTIIPDPDAGYEVDEIIVTDKNGNPVTVIDNGDGTYSFKQPSGKVNIEVTFKEIVKVCPGDKTCPMYGYTDLDMTAWYHDGVHFCIANDLMTGTASDTFAPGMTTSRAMIVTILWRLEGKPVVNYAMSFEDVAADTWYTEAVRWAQANKIVSGYSNESFGPNDDITREQLATILYRYEQYKGGGFTGAWMIRMDYVDLADVSDWAYEAMCWMNMNSIVNGKPGKVLDPEGNATRAEAATMLYRYCDVIGKDDEN